MEETKTKPEEAPKHSSVYVVKEAVLGVVTIILSVLTWFLLAMVLKVEFFVNNFSLTTFNTGALWSLSLLFLSFVLWSAFFIISASLISKKRVIYFISLLNSLAVFIFFGLNVYSAISFLLLCYILVHYGTKVFLETRGRIKFSLYLSMRHGLTWLVTIVLLVVSLTYYHAYTQEGQKEDSFRQSIITSTVSFTNSTVKWQIPEYAPEMSLDDFIKLLSGQSLSSLDSEALGSLGLTQGLSENEIQKLLQDQIVASGQMLEGELLAQTRDEFLKRFEIRAKGTDSMDAVMVKILEKYVDRFIVPYEKYFPLIITLSLFFALSVFAPIFTILIKIFALIFFYILMWSGFAVKQKIQIEAERVDIKS